MSGSEKMRKPQTALEMKFQGATQQTASLKGRYPFNSKESQQDALLFSMPLKKKKPASLAKETQPTKSLLLATNNSEPIISENEADRNSKINKNVLAVSKFITVPEPALDIAMRRARDEEIAKNKQLNKHKLCHHAIMLFQAIQQDYSEKIAQSIQSLTALIENPKFSIPRKKIFTKDSITQYFTNTLSQCSKKSLFKHMTELLKCRICEIAEELPKSPLINGKVEIVSLVLKTILQFQEYLPPQDYSYNSNLWHIKPKFISTLLDIPNKQFKIIKKLFIENNSKLAYISNEFRIHDLVIAYYILLLKNKFSVKRCVQLKKYCSQLTIAEFKARKQKITERRKNQMIEEGSITLSQLFANRSQRENLVRLLSVEEIIDSFEIFQEIGQSNMEQVTATHPKIQMLADKYQTRAKFIVDKYRGFINRKRAFIVRYGSSLSELKDGLITKQLIQNPYSSYEQVFNNVYYRNKLYIERSYFVDNFHRLLEKETHYQQLRYLEKVFKAAFECKGKANVFFIDRCSLIEGRESAIVNVSLAGDLHCKKSPDSLQFLKEIKEFLLTSQSSVVLLFDDKFPFSERLEESEELFLISKIHSLCFLPRASLVPNPCQEIANSLKQMFTEQCSLVEAIQNALEEFDRRRVMQVALKEFEKAQRLAYPDSPQCNQQSEANKDERADSNIEEGSDLQDNQDEEEDEVEDEVEEDVEEDEEENEGVKFLFPRDTKDGFSPSTPQPLIMDNLLERSTSDLQLALARFLQLNKSKSILRNP